LWQEGQELRIADETEGGQTSQYKRVYQDLGNSSDFTSPYFL